MFLATNRAGELGPVQERVDDTNDKFARLRSTYESATRSTTRRGPLPRRRERDRAAGAGCATTCATARVDPAGAISRYTDATSAVLTFDEPSPARPRTPRSPACSNGLYALTRSASRTPTSRPSSPRRSRAGGSTPPRSTRRATPRCAAASPSTSSAARWAPTTPRWPTAVVGPDVDARATGSPRSSSAGAVQACRCRSPRRTGTPRRTRCSRGSPTSPTSCATRAADNAAALQNGARNAAGVASVVLLLALMAGAAVVFFVTRSLLRPLRLLRRTALDVAERRLPAAVEQPARGRGARHRGEPDPDRDARGDRPGRPRVRPGARAGGAARGRAGRPAHRVNSIFVNLSRRSQALVERQLRLIEQLENKEEDPEALAEPLPARPPRDPHAPQLGEPPGALRHRPRRRGGRPVPLADVLRAAASEVEQYQRRRAGLAAVGQLLGRTGGRRRPPVAELLENAAAFSAPETRVDVTARPEQDGAIVLEISDRGVGMTDQDLSEANQRSARRPPSTSPPRGAWACSWSAGSRPPRHQRASRRRAHGRRRGGLTASVTLPAHLVMVSGDVEPGPMRRSSPFGAASPRTAFRRSGPEPAHAARPVGCLPTVGRSNGRLGLNGLRPARSARTERPRKPTTDGSDAADPMTTEQPVTAVWSVRRRRTTARPGRPTTRSRRRRRVPTRPTAPSTRRRRRSDRGGPDHPGRRRSRRRARDRRAHRRGRPDRSPVVDRPSGPAGRGSPEASQRQHPGGRRRRAPSDEDSADASRADDAAAPAAVEPEADERAAPRPEVPPRRRRSTRRPTTRPSLPTPAADEAEAGEVAARAGDEAPTPGTSPAPRADDGALASRAVRPRPTPRPCPPPVRTGPTGI